MAKKPELTSVFDYDTRTTSFSISNKELEQIHKVYPDFPNDANKAIKKYKVKYKQTDGKHFVQTESTFDFKPIWDALKEKDRYSLAKRTWVIDEQNKIRQEIKKELGLIQETAVMKAVDRKMEEAAAKLVAKGLFKTIKDAMEAINS